MRKVTEGLTLVELVVTMAVMAILAAVAFPGMSDYYDKQRLISQTRAIIDLAQLARSEAIKHSAAGAADAKSVAMTISPTSPWFIGLSNGSAACSGTSCVINQGGASVSHTVSADDCTGCTMTAPTGQTVIVFDLRGLASGAAARTVTLRSPKGRSLTLSISRLGRISVCSPGGSVTGYVTC
jgi:type IV fimbrial biogenesis protein FimT